MAAAPIDRNGLEVLDLEESLELLASEPVGRVAFMTGGEPVILPVNHVVVGSRVAFRTSPGSKLDAAIMARMVAFEVDQYHPDRRGGWSVVIRGVADEVMDDQLIAELEASDVHPWADAVPKAYWVVIRPDEVTGRRIARNRRPAITPD